MASCATSDPTIGTIQVLSVPRKLIGSPSSLKPENDNCCGDMLASEKPSVASTTTSRITSPTTSTEPCTMSVMTSPNKPPTVV
jgi:hypothetical protein